MSKYVFNVARYGAWSSDRGTVGKAIQSATDDAVAARDAVVYFPPRGGNQRYETDRPTVVTVDGDHDARVTFAGAAGRRGTRLRLADHDEPVFDFATTGGGNLRGITIRDLAIYDGISAIRMDHCAYLSFENVSFMQQYGYSVDAVNSFNIAFSNCWWVHLIGDVASAVNGSIYFDGCHFGEDGGSFYSDGYMQFNGGSMWKPKAKLLPNGYKDMGPAVFTVVGGGQVHVRGTNIGGVDGHLFNLDNCDEISLIGCTVRAGTGPLVAVRRADRSYPVQIQNNTIRFEHDAALFQSFLNRPVAGLQYTGNSWLIDDSVAVDLSIPPEGNMDTNNMVWRGSL